MKTCPLIVACALLACALNTSAISLPSYIYGWEHLSGDTAGGWITIGTNSYSLGHAPAYDQNNPSADLVDSSLFFLFNGVGAVDAWNDDYFLSADRQSLFLHGTQLVFGRVGWFIDFSTTGDEVSWVLYTLGNFQDPVAYRTGRFTISSVAAVPDAGATALLLLAGLGAIVRIRA